MSCWRRQGRLRGIAVEVLSINPRNAPGSARVEVAEDHQLVSDLAQMSRRMICRAGFGLGAYCRKPLAKLSISWPTIGQQFLLAPR